MQINMSSMAGKMATAVGENNKLERSEKTLSRIFDAASSFRVTITERLLFIKLPPPFTGMDREHFLPFHRSGRVINFVR